MSTPNPGPENVNQRSSMLRRLFRFYFHQDMPYGPYRLQRTWFRRSPLGYGRGRVAVAADLKVKVPERAIVPLQPEQVARCWESFRTARDLGIVALLLLNGLRSREVPALKLEDLLFSEAQIRVHGKGARVRLLPLPPETIRLLRCYLKTERPLTNAASHPQGDSKAGSFRFSERTRPRHSPEARGIAFFVPPPPHHQPGQTGQPASLPAHIWSGYDSRQCQPAGAAAPDGPLPHSHHAALHSTDPAGCVR